MIKKPLEFIIRNILYVLASIGVPIYYLWYNYGLLETYDAITKLKVSGIVIVLITMFFAKGYISSFIFSMKLTWFKKLLWGVERTIPLIGVNFIIWYTIEYGAIAMEIIAWTIVSNLFAYLVAPFNIINKKEKTGN